MKNVSEGTFINLSQKDKELHELRAKGLATNGLKRFTDLSSKQISSILHSYSQTKRCANAFEESNDDYQKRGIGEFEKEWRCTLSMSTSSSDSNDDCQQTGLDDFEKEWRCTLSMSTSSSNSNAPFIFTDCGESTSSTVSSITVAPRLLTQGREFQMEGQSKLLRNILLGKLPIEEEEGIIFQDDESGREDGKSVSFHVEEYYGERDEILTPIRRFKINNANKKPILSTRIENGRQRQDPPEQNYSSVKSKKIEDPPEQNSNAQSQKSEDERETKVDPFGGSVIDSLSSVEPIGISQVRENSKISNLVTQLKRSKWSGNSKGGRGYENMTNHDEDDLEGQLSLNENFISRFYWVRLKSKQFKGKLWLTVFMVGVIIGLIMIFLSNLKRDDENSVESNIEVPNNAGHNPLSRAEELLHVLESLSGSHTFDDVNSPEYMAYEWLVNDYTILDAPTRSDKMFERYIVSLLYFSTSGGDWSKKYNFLSAESVCKWNVAGQNPDQKYGVVCDDTGYVVGIDLANNNLEGTLPWELGSLEHLNVLHLRENKLTGDFLSHRLDLLTNLQHLDLMSNDLQGTMPTELGWLQKLRHIDIGSNKIIGMIPTEVGRLEKLERLIMTGNRLEGSLPHELGFLSNLKSMDLSSNNLQGTIPSSIGKLQQLQVLYLQENTLIGNLEESFCFREYASFATDCLGSGSNIASCSCCTSCCTDTVCCGEFECFAIQEFSNNIIARDNF